MKLISKTKTSAYSGGKTNTFFRNVCRFYKSYILIAQLFSIQ